MASRYQAIVDQFYSNRLLFGDPAQPGIVAVEVASPAEVELFRRTAEGISRERRPLQLFVLLADRALLNGFNGPYRIEQLQGGARFSILAVFNNLAVFEAARRHLRSKAGGAPGPDAPYFTLNDPVDQHQLITGATFFMGLQFDALRRLQLDVEVAISPGFEYPNAGREGDRLAAIAITDSTGFEQVLAGDAMDERAMLQELVRIVNQRDPDVIEGHGLFRFDLEYLEARARRHKLKLALGRDGSLMRGRAARMQIAERTIAYRRYDVYGRSLIDTWILVQHYDISSRELEGFELGEIAHHFRVEREGRARLERQQVAASMTDDPQALRRHSLANAREIGGLARILSASYFVQAQIFPYPYQSVIVRGNATKIDALMLRAYLAARHSVPAPSAPEAVAGGYTEIRRAGVARPVLHCDVTSLYPSLMLQYRHGPASDGLSVFLRMLEDLRSFRVQAKQMVRELEGDARRSLDALQQTFKILINSFYGYLGFSLGHFNDFGQANEITRRGRELIQRAIVELEKRGAAVVEVDTDGIYFVPPPGLTDEEALLGEIAAAMPEGIRLEIDGHYPAMFSYKMKNYVLLAEAGELVIRGSGLKSRGLERFQRRFMEELFRLLMTDRHLEAQGLLAEYRGKIDRHELGIRELMKTDTLQDSLDLYRQKVSGKRRNLAAAYELALKSQRPYNSGDQISYYVAGRGTKVKVNAAARLASDYDSANPDENREYYQAKLEELFAKFKPYVDRPGLFDPAELEAKDQAVQEEIFEPPAGGDE